METVNKNSNYGSGSGSGSGYGSGSGSGYGSGYSYGQQFQPFKGERGKMLSENKQRKFLGYCWTNGRRGDEVEF